MSFNPPTHFCCSFHLQLLIAFCLETEQGHWKVATIYVIGGISGSLATLYLQPELSLMGASAGVYALLMSHIPHLLKVSEAYSMPSTPPNSHWTNIPHLCVCVFLITKTRIWYQKYSQRWWAAFIFIMDLVFINPVRVWNKSEILYLVLKWDRFLSVRICFLCLLQNFQWLTHRYLRILALLILFLSDICFTTFHIVINHNANPRICVEAHVAGALTGLVLGFLFYTRTSKGSSGTICAQEMNNQPCFWVACSS